MKKFACVALMLLVAASFVPLASAQLLPPTVTFIPSQISANSSFILMVDPRTDDPVRVTWFTYGTQIPLPVIGQVPKTGDRWVCYFSNTDVNSTCGPSPYSAPGDDYVFNVTTTDASLNTGDSGMVLDVGGVELITQTKVNFENRTVDLVVYPSTVVDGVSYETYYTKNMTKVPGKQGDLTWDVNSYVDKISLDIGEYYIVYSSTTGGGDHGGAVERIVMSSTGEVINGGLGYVDVDSVKLNILIEKNQKYEKSNFRITNLKNQTLGSLTVEIPVTEPIDINDYLRVQLENTTLGPLDSMFFSVILENVVNYMEIKTQAQLKSNNSLIGYIPIDIKVSVKNESGTTMTTCDGKSDGADCYGGICCSEVCRKKANCCVDDDCSSDYECTSYNCVYVGGQQQDIPCTTGTCHTDLISCPSGESWTGSCRESGVDGICCEPTVDECEGESDMTSCSSGVCCNEVCISGDCCSSDDCPNPGDICDYNVTWDSYWCEPPEAQPFDITIPLIVLVVIIAAAGAYYFMKKRKGGEGMEEEFEEGSEEFDEEFY